MGELFGSLVGTIMIVAFLVLLFFLLRNVMLWYYKINEIVTVLNEIKEELKKR